jgi:hypothetical protein
VKRWKPKPERSVAMKGRGGIAGGAFRLTTLGASLNQVSVTAVSVWLAITWCTGSIFAMKMDCRKMDGAPVAPFWIDERFLYCRGATL